MLYPSQAGAVETLHNFLPNSPVSIVDGLSGSGKSLIARTALSSVSPGLIVESGAAMDRLNEIMAAIAGKMSVIILTQPGSDTSQFREIHHDIPMVKVQSLTPNEVEAWISTIEPALQLDERECVLRYSLGIPLLLQRMCNFRPITQIAARIQCTFYLQNLIEKCHLYGENRNQELQKILEAYTTSFCIPDDVVEGLVDRGFSNVKGSSIQLLQNSLLEGCDVPVPTSAEIFQRYNEWLKQHLEEPSFDVFVSTVENPARIINEIGYCDSPNSSSLLRRFSMTDTRKGVTYFAERGFFSQRMCRLAGGPEDYIYTALLALARAQGKEATLSLRNMGDRQITRLKLQDDSRAMYLHKHDHSPRDVMPVAYTIECVLQREGLAYTVKYNDVFFHFDPQSRRYIPLNMKKVDYFQELYGEKPKATSDAH